MSPSVELFFGQASGSAMPLVWAHAEYLKLCRSLRDGRIFDWPPQSVQRYLVDGHDLDGCIWRFNDKVRAMPPAQRSASRRSPPPSCGGAATTGSGAAQVATPVTTLGVHVADLARAPKAANRLAFTFYWRAAGAVKGRLHFTVEVELHRIPPLWHDGGSIVCTFAIASWPAYPAWPSGCAESALFVVGTPAGLVLYHAAFGFTSAWRVLMPTAAARACARRC